VLIRQNAWRRAARLEALRPAGAWRPPIRMDEGPSSAAVAGRRRDPELLDERLIPARPTGRPTGPDVPAVVRSPMPGLIVEVRVKVGDRVRAGSAVVVMEAMKMRNELCGEVDGVVKAVYVKPLDSVESRAPLIEVARAE
jgi:biotin carboxyl carrier protein